MRRRGRSRRRPIPRIKNPVQPIDSILSAMQFQDGADNRANHTPQKGIRLNLEVDQISFSPTAGFVNFTDRVDSIAPCTLERGKIPLAD